MSADCRHTWRDTAPSNESLNNDTLQHVIPGLALLHGCKAASAVLKVADIQYGPDSTDLPQCRHAVPTCSCQSKAEHASKALSTVRALCFLTLPSWSKTLSCSKAQHSTAQHSTAQHSTAHRRCSLISSESLNVCHGMATQKLARENGDSFIWQTRRPMAREQLQALKDSIECNTT